MWILSKRAKQLTDSQQQSDVLTRTKEQQNLAQKLLKTQEEEKRKLARDLHDSTGQTLVALKIGIALLEQHCKHDETAMGYVSNVVKLANQAVTEIRTMSYLLHPPLMDELGFACAAEWFIEGFAKRSGVKVCTDIATPQERMPMEVEIALFRVLQESLTNANRHSGASEIHVHFRQMPERIVLEIRDDGSGFCADRLELMNWNGPGAGVGLAGMRERMDELNGSLEIKSNSAGTTIRATVPLLAVSTPDELGRTLNDPIYPTSMVTPIRGKAPSNSRPNSE